jgi:hypothetical protein
MEWRAVERRPIVQWSQGGAHACQRSFCVVAGMARPKCQHSPPRAQDGFLQSGPDVVPGMTLRRRRRHSYQPRAFALGSSPQAQLLALKARLILPPRQEQPPQCYEAGRWPALGKQDHEPRANALGWYEAGRWPESNGVSPQARIGQLGGKIGIRGGTVCQIKVISMDVRA